MSSVYARILIGRKSAAKSLISKYPQLMLETYMLADRGGAFGTNLSNTNWFKTQEDAIEHALNWTKHWLNVQIEQERNRNSSVCKSAAKILKEIENLLPKKRYVQLELFEF